MKLRYYFFNRRMFILIGFFEFLKVENGEKLLDLFVFLDFVLNFLYFFGY